MKINIVGLHKADVLLALYNNASFNGPEFASQPMMKIMARMSPPASPDAALKEIEERSEGNNYYFDYVDLGSGPRPLIVDLSGFDFESTSYDKYHGEGAAKAIVSALRQAAIAEYEKSSQESSFASLLAKVGSAISQQENNPLTPPATQSTKQEPTVLKK